MGGATNLGPAAAQTMLSYGTWRAGHCLEAVVSAYRAVGVPSLGRPAPTAYVGWQNSDDQHPGDRNPPAGVPVWWGPKPTSAAGDVVISLGGGRVVATDWPRSGVIGITTIDARERQINRPYLGWTGDILGAPINQEEDMALNADTDYPAFRDMLFRALKWDIRPDGAGPDWKLGPTIWERLNAIEAAAKAGVSIDPGEVAAAIAAAIPTDIAGDVVDELTKRLQA